MPGTIYTDLLNNKLIPDPFYGDNEKLVQWVDTCDWEYEAEFTISEVELKQNHIEIDFKGLDTYAKVYANDSLVIDADNMFREWNRDIKSNIHAGRNHLSIRFNSTLKHDIAEEKKLPYKLPGEERVFSRKAQYQYGWDFAPRFIGCGIWKDVSLTIWSDAILGGFGFKYSLAYHIDSVEPSVFIDGSVRLDSANEASPHAPPHLKGSSNNAKNYLYWQKHHQAKYYLVIKFEGEEPDTIDAGNRGLLSDAGDIIKIHNMQLWWCKGMGNPKLYQVVIELWKRNVGMLDSKSYDVGFRRIELVQDSDKIGKSFYFKLNDVPVFMKGANYVPPDMFLPRVNKAKYDSLVDMAADANMNMLRVWGGGVYADDEFYKECDRKGILVWQDFMFACGMYPFDDIFEKNAYTEVTHETSNNQHPCFALYCGNNECTEGWYNWDWQRQYHYSEIDSAKIWRYHRYFFDSTLDYFIYEPTQQLFWGLNYVPTSPQIGWGHEEAMRCGDSHYWGVWWGMEPFEIYNKKVPRFMSEYGFQSLPDMETLNKITDTLSLTSIKLKNHQKHPTGFQTIDEYMKRDFIVPAKFEDYVYVSQLLQAEGMQTAIEAHRRHKPTCMGTLYWQFNDCWPGITWSSIDYYGKPKALYYRAKELYDNVLISVIKENGKYNVYIVSDSMKPLKSHLVVQLMGFDGKVLAEQDMGVNVPANSSVFCSTLGSDFLDKIDTTKSVLVCSFMNRKKLFYFAKQKNLNLPKAKVDFKLLDGNMLVLKSSTLAKNVYIHLDGVTFSDNYFDLLPGEKKIIKWSGKKTFTESDVTITSLGNVMSR